MKRRAWIYIGSVLLAGTVVSGLAIRSDQSAPASDLLIFVALTALTLLTQFLEAEAPGRHSYYPHLVFIFAGALLLHQLFFVLLVVVPHLVEWVRKRLSNSPMLRDWYIQPFNIATHLIAGFAARSLLGASANMDSLIRVASVIAVLGGAMVYVLLNHSLVGLALFVARGISLRESGVLAPANLFSDLVQLFLGYIVAILWNLNPLLILPALSPLAMIYRALTIPQLQQEAHTDAKTGLWNSGHFNKLFAAELERAQRFDRPLAVIMADLDLLRNINNSYGHVAGDTVLAGIGRIIRGTIREYDIAARFGGEEFAIVLLEAGWDEARAVAERVRAAVAAATFEVATSPTPIHATMSFGIACYPGDAATATDLIHAADLGVYQAKLNGRNRVVSASEVPHSVKLTTLPAADHPHTDCPVVSTAKSPSTNTAAATTEAAPQDTSTPKPEHPKAIGRDYSPLLLPLLIGGVLASGVAAIVLAIGFGQQPDLSAVALLTALAIVAELFQVNVYGDNTVSVSVAIAFAAALITGLTGVAAVSAGIAATHFVQRRPRLYKLAFNWATHVLASLAPVLIIRAQAISLGLTNLPLLAVLTLVSGLVYYATEVGLIASAIGLSQQSSPVTVWRRQFKWLFSHYLTLCGMGLILALAYGALGILGLSVFVLPVFLARHSQKQYVERTEESMRELKRMNRELTQANREVMTASHAIHQLNDELFLTLSKIIDARDPFAAGHAAKVADYATSIGSRLGLKGERLEHLRQAALLHDVGKLGIPEQILFKPDKLTHDEYAVIKNHSALGANFLESCQGLRHLANFVRNHHEWWNGNGYPSGLSKESIPIEARILAVCDAVEAMASDRPYNRAMSLAEIIAELRRCAGTQFEPKIVGIFENIVKQEGESFVVNSAREIVRQQATLPNGHKGALRWVVPVAPDPAMKENV